MLSCKYSILNAVVIHHILCQTIALSKLRGHLEPFGKHTVPHGIEVREDFPSPIDFYERYQRLGKPVLFKGVLPKVKFPPFSDWTDDYLKRKFGNLVIQVEGGKKENRGGSSWQLHFKNFLDDYKQENIYMVQDLTKSMYDDMYIPRSIKCGGFQNFIETIVIWFSSGGTKSVVHLDTLDNINCLLDGTKDLVFVDRKYEREIEADGFKDEGGYSYLDVDQVDMEVYPKIQDVPTFVATMEAGDCLFIPYKWYHQVNSFGTRNIAVNIWLSHIPWFNYTDCTGGDLSEQTVPFKNYGYVTKERQINLYLLDELLDKGTVTKEQILGALVKPEADDKEEIWLYLDKNDDGLVTWDELFSLDIMELIGKFEKSLKLTPNFRQEMEGMKFIHNDVTQIEVEKPETKDEL